MYFFLSEIFLLFFQMQLKAPKKVKIFSKKASKWTVSYVFKNIFINIGKTLKKVTKCTNKAAKWQVFFTWKHKKKQETVLHTCTIVYIL